jgi:hypothetical protein
VIVLRCADDGVYTVPWQVHAENLMQPANGELTLELVTNVETGLPITDVEELIALVWPDDSDDPDGAV